MLLKDEHMRLRGSQAQSEITSWRPQAPALHTRRCAPESHLYDAFPSGSMEFTNLSRHSTCRSSAPSVQLL